METGSLVHAYLQRYLLDSGLDREKLAILGTVMEPPASCDRVIGRAAEILDRYYSGVTLDAWGRPLRERAGRAEIIAREFPVMLDFQGKVQYRIIDLILEEAGGLVVVDFKTGEKPSELPDRYRLQQEIYPRAVRLLAPGKPVSFEFWWLGGGA